MMNDESMTIPKIKNRIKELRIEKALDEIFAKFSEKYQARGDNKTFFIIRDSITNREILNWSDICQGLFLIEITGNYDGMLEITFKTNEDKIEWLKEQIFVIPEYSSKYVKTESDKRWMEKELKLKDSQQKD